MEILAQWQIWDSGSFSAQTVRVGRVNGATNLPKTVWEVEWWSMCCLQFVRAQLIKLHDTS